MANDEVAEVVAANERDDSGFPLGLRRSRKAPAAVDTAPSRPPCHGYRGDVAPADDEIQSDPRHEIGGEG